MVHAADKEQVEMLSKWWRDYGRGILIAMIIGLLIGFGWKYWNQHQLKHRAGASKAYLYLLELSHLEKVPAMKNELNVIKKKFKETPYAALGSLLVAKQEVKDNKLDDALAELKWVIDNSFTQNFQEIARLRAARILLEQKQYDAALNILKPVRDEVFKPMLLTVEGDIYLAQGDKPKAQKAYRDAQQSYQALNLDNPFLSMKLSTGQ